MRGRATGEVRKLGALNTTHNVKTDHVDLAAILGGRLGSEMASVGQLVS